MESVSEDQSNIPAPAQARQSSTIEATADLPCRRNSNRFRRSFSMGIFPNDREAGLIVGDLGSRRIGSMRYSRGVELQLFEDAENESVARAGDAGDRSFGSNRCTGKAEFPDDSVLQFQQSGFWNDAALRMNAPASNTSPLPAEICSPLSPDPLLRSGSMKHNNKPKEQNTRPQGNQKKLLAYISCRIHLAVFGILGVFTRYLLQKLFGPRSIGFTSDGSTLYLDLPSNMLGSFLMGWLGIIFKGDIIHFSNDLAVGLTTGFLGSLTTFSGWNQKMLELALEGKWALTVIGFVVDMLIVASCVSVGVTSAKGFRWLLAKYATCNTENCCKVDYRMLHATIFSLLVLLLSLLWALSIAFFKTGIEDQETIAQLWLAFIVGPPGVWLRYFLAGYNGRGFGKGGSMKWLPFGTLAANVLAAILMASSTTVKKAVNTKRCDIIINGFQLGFLGCLSTVSTFVAEFYAMNESKRPWRAYVYTMFTIIVPVILGSLVYILPVRIKYYQ